MLVLVIASLLHAAAGQGAVSNMSGRMLSSGSVVSQHGRLQARGNRIVDEAGQPVRLRGMSLFWSQWQSQYWNKDALKTLVTDWKITLIRCAMGIEEGGYLENPEVEKARVETVVNAAIELGIYVIIDWHDHHADQHEDEAKDFFRQMAEKYGSEKNVLFETFNEPKQQDWSTVIKPYHEAVLPEIRKYSQNLVILGTRTWSQEVDVAAAHPVTDTNVAYTIHFYASTHKDEIRARVRTALCMNVAIFSTEWGTCSSSGNGTLDLNEAQTWLTFFEENNISDANWAVSDKLESCSALKPGASGTGNWPTSELTQSGAFVRASLRGDPLPAPAPGPGPAPAPTSCASDTEDCSSSRCCADEAKTCYKKNDYWAACRSECTPGINPLDKPKYQTSWSCEVLSKLPPAPGPCPTPDPASKPSGGSSGFLNAGKQTFALPWRTTAILTALTIAAACN